MSAESLTAKKDAMVRALERARRNQPTLLELFGENMVAELKCDGRREPNYALDWWRSVENSSVVDLRKRRLSLAPLFLDAARAFLSIQTSSASDSSGTLGTRSVLVGKKRALP